MEDYNKEDRIMIAAVASAVAKAILYIGLCITLGMLLSKCSVNSETIIQCEESGGWYKRSYFLELQVWRR